MVSLKSLCLRLIKSDQANGTYLCALVSLTDSVVVLLKFRPPSDRHRPSGGFPDQLSIHSQNPYGLFEGVINYLVVVLDSVN